MKTCEGRVAIITGAAGDGMGRSTALTLAREGAKVVVNFRSSADKARAVVDHILNRGGEAVAVQADVFTGEGCAKLVDAAMRRFGQVDICLVGPGGGWRMGPIEKINPADCIEDVRREVAPVFHLFPLVLPGMFERKWGRMVVLSFDGAEDHDCHALSYSVGKLARTAAMMVSQRKAWKHSVTVNVIGPGPVEPLPSLAQAVELCDHGEGWTKRKDTTPQDIAEGVAFLCSEAGSYVSGTLVQYMSHGG